MFISKSIQTGHSDLIHDVAFDYYGRRMATCSSDQMIKIWDLRDDQEWVCTARWRNHLGSVWRISWAHPEFGQIIATCSFDRTIAIWEEITGQCASVGAPDQAVDQTPWATGRQQSASNQSGLETPSISTNWVRRAHLVDPRTSVTGLQFAPRFLGLKIAAISTDGILRIYEAQDVMNLSQWTLQFDFGTKMNGSCLAWSQSRQDPPLIAVGSSSRETAAYGGSVEAGLNHSTNQNNSTGYLESSFVRGNLVLYEYKEGVRHWHMVQDVAGLEDPVFDLAFAPSMGQSFQTLAVGSTEVLILRIKAAAPIKDADKSSQDPNSTTESRGSSYTVSIMAQFNHHRGKVWRVSWNITGSLLASTGDDGTVRLWRANFLNAWRPVAVIPPGGSVAPDTGLPFPPPNFSADVTAVIDGEHSQRNSTSFPGVARTLPSNGTAVNPISSDVSLSAMAGDVTKS